jgi:hypothetical protein
MNTLAEPQDLLLAYDPDFTGFTGAGAGAGATPAAPVVGGDGYYEDFTAGLKRFVDEHPMLARGGPLPHGPVDWKAMVISFGIPGDSDDSDDDGGFDDDVDGDSDDDGGFDDDGDSGAVLAQLGDFIVDIDGAAGNGARGEKTYGGEMDETDAEASPYERFRAMGGHPRGSIIDFVADR